MYDFDLLLQETSCLDFSQPTLDDFLRDFSPGTTPKQTAVKLYYFVRDAFLYDPYHLDLRPEALRASVIVGKKRAWCVEKAIVLAAACRKFGIPSQLGYAVVTNHIGVDKLREYLKRPEIVFHGYVSVWIDGKWIKCTPAFDARVCRVSGVDPLDWDGEHDSMFQAFQGDRIFMEYLHSYGEFADVPIDQMNTEMRNYYPHLFRGSWNSKAFSFIPKSEFLLDDTGA